MIIRLSDISMIKMSVNPPKSVVDADYCVIKDGTVHQYAVSVGLKSELQHNTIMTTYHKF